MSTKTFIINGVEVPIATVPQKNHSTGKLFTLNFHAITSSLIPDFDSYPTVTFS